MEGKPIFESARTTTVRETADWGGPILSKTNIKLSKDMFARVKRCAEVAGYSSPQEFVEHVLEKELAKLEEADSDEDILNKLKGLGYLE